MHFSQISKPSSTFKMAHFEANFHAMAVGTSNCWLDKSDKRGCQLLVLEEGYNMKVPPIPAVSSTNDTLVPTQVNISLVLKKVVEIEEVDHSIHLKFQIILEWKETRATFHNLKLDTSLNTLTDGEVGQLWLPLVIYDNTDQEETTRLGSPWEWTTTVTVTSIAITTKQPICRPSL